MRQIPVYLKNEVYGLAQVDDSHFDIINQCKWYAVVCKNGRLDSVICKIPTPETTRKYITPRMPHLIMNNTNSKLQIDHIDRNPLNNQTSNLRLVTPQENSWNRQYRSVSKSSKYIGVSFRRYKDSSKNKWRATYGVGNRRKETIGHYYIEEDAAKARDYYVRRQRGNFAVLNFPDIDILPVSDSKSKRKGA